MQKITVLLADDHTLVRQGFRALLEAEPDIAMTLLNGLEATRQIIKEVPSSKVLVLTSYSDDEYVHQLTEAGAAGYLLKEAVVTDLVKAIREARKGRGFFSPAISKRLMDH